MQYALLIPCISTDAELLFSISFHLAVIAPKQVQAQVNRLLRGHRKCYLQLL